MTSYNVVLYCPDTHLQYDGRTPDTSGIGGSEMSRLRLLEALAARGHSVTAFVNCGASGIHGGVSYHPFPKATAIDCDVLITVSAGGKMDLSAIGEVKRKARVTIARIGGVPRPAGLEVLKPDYFYVSSNFLRRHITDSWNVAPKQVFVSYPGLMSEYFQHAAQKPVPRDPFSLVFAGHPSKGLSRTIAVLRELRIFDSRFHLDVFGGQELWGDVTDPFRPEPGVEFHGVIGQKDLITRLFQYSYMVTIPDTPEGFGNAVQEGRRAGVIVIAGPKGAFLELIRSGRDGFLLQEAPVIQQIEQAAALILTLNEHPDFAERIRGFAQDSILDWNLTAQTHEAHWDKILNGGPTPSERKCTECGGGMVPYPDGKHCSGCGFYEAPVDAIDRPFAWLPDVAKRTHALRIAVGQTTSHNRFMEAELKALQPVASAQERTIQKLEERVARQQEGIEWLRGEVKLRQDQLDAIFKSAAWKTVQAYRGVRRRLGGKARALATPTAQQVLQSTGSASRPDHSHALCYFEDPVSIVIVTYNNLECTRQCLESVLRNSDARNLEVIVVDNNSSDNTPQYLQALASREERVRIVLNETNAGFAAANNLGLKIAGGKFLVLLNNDTVVPPGWLSRLVNHLRDEKIGLVGPLTNFVGNEARIPTTYESMEDMEEFAVEKMLSNQEEIADIQMLAMFCIAFRRSVYDSIGPLDERFGIGMFEDDDYSHRVRQAGFRIVCAGNVFVHHYGQASFKSLIRNGAYDRLFERNKVLFEEKWKTRWVAHQHGELQFATHEISSVFYDKLLAGEAEKWAGHLQFEASGNRNAWLDHPVISLHYHERGLIEGLHWQEWVLQKLGSPAERCLSLGCGAGSSSFELFNAGSAVQLEGFDISAERVAVAEGKRKERGIAGQFLTLDLNKQELEPGAYDLIFASHSFHHFVELEFIIEQVLRALTPRGLFVLEEYVGPTQFQWTDEQMRHTRERLARAPERLRRYRSGVLKVEEGRPTPEEVVAVSPFESIRSGEIVPLFHRSFRPVAVRMLGGTLQHLLYNGIIHNFDEDDPDAREFLRGTMELEDHLIDTGELPSDFQLLIGSR